ncbi:MAG: protoporphyrinogen oxidase [Gemmataceae bacterium]|nr:protoporphyrinogen oxidase [Gemmata sp.]MDW8198930.1 protoporphyrinogen oxidase [Gemmataceae bacterium]
MPQVVVVGGGLTGLTVAFRLKQWAAGISVVLLESGDRPGGNIGTEWHEGFRVERGPNGFLDRTPAVPDLVRDLGLSAQLIAASDGSRKNRYVFVRGQLHKLPRGPLGLLTTPLLSWRGKWQLLSEPWRKSQPVSADESVHDFVTRRAGQEAADIFADALVTGIHGGDPRQLSVAATFPRLPVLEREAGSIIRGFLRAARQRKKEAKAQGLHPPGPMRMWSFREGLQVLIDALTQHLGDTVQCGVAVRSITKPTEASPWIIHTDRTTFTADAVVLTCPAYEQAAILHDYDRTLAEEIAGIPYNRIAVVALGYRRDDCPGGLDGFGYIAPQNTRRDLLGVQWCSSIFPDRAPPGFVLWRALCGGVHRGEQLDWDDDRLVKAVHAEIRLAMGVRGEPVFQRIIRWPKAIPQYVCGHLDRMARIEELASRHAGLFLTGNAYRGVAMADCVEQAGRIATQVSRMLLPPDRKSSV